MYLKGCSALKILEAVGWEKGTLDSSIGEDAVDDPESGRSVGLVVPFCVYLGQYICQYGGEVGNRGPQTSAGSWVDAESPLGFDLFFGVSMPRARFDSLIFRQRKKFLESKIGLATQ